MTRSLIYLVSLGGLSLLLCGLLAYGKLFAGGLESASQNRRQLVRVLGLTDLSLSSEARYTRHPTQADLFSAFQDFPAALEHFPSGSVVLPNPSGFSSRVLVESRPGQDN